MPPPDSIFKIFSYVNSVLYRWSGGKLGGQFQGSPILLMTVIGRKSGQPRTVPLVFLQDGKDFIIAASKGGAEKDPVWLLNLEQAGGASVAVGNNTCEVTAARVPDAEKPALWKRLVELQPLFKSYEAATTRAIPLIRLTPK